jgi:hypothetical protein
MAITAFWDQRKIVARMGSAVNEVTGLKSPFFNSLARKQALILRQTGFSETVQKVIHKRLVCGGHPLAHKINCNMGNNIHQLFAGVLRLVGLARMFQGGCHAGVRWPRSTLLERLLSTFHCLFMLFQIKMGQTVMHREQADGRIGGAQPDRHLGVGNCLFRTP